MAVIKELIRKEADGKLSFGNYELPKKTKVEDFDFEGDLYKVKTFNEITKLEKNGLFLYESVPGTAVTGFKETGDGVEFNVEAAEDVQITLGLEDEKLYEIFIGGVSTGAVQTGLGGKLSISVETGNADAVSVKVVKA
ncbi:MAG: endosialidase [Lachnospiraceae bacterium]|nr:endosialidase [Lachnospiraceae bacterium]